MYHMYQVLLQLYVRNNVCEHTIETLSFLMNPTYLVCLQSCITKSMIILTTSDEFEFDTFHNPRYTRSTASRDCFTCGVFVSQVVLQLHKQCSLKELIAGMNFILS